MEKEREWQSIYIQNGKETEEQTWRKSCQNTWEYLANSKDNSIFQAVICATMYTEEKEGKKEKN